MLTKVERQIALRLLKIWADKGYQGDLQNWFMKEWQISLEIVSAQAGQKGFAVQPAVGLLSAVLLGLANIGA